MDSHYLKRYFKEETPSQKIKKTPNLVYDSIKNKTRFINFDILNLSLFDILNSSQLSNILRVDSTFVNNNIIISFYDERLIFKVVKCCEKYKDIVKIIKYNNNEIELEPISTDVFPVEIIILASKHGHLKNVQYILMDGEHNSKDIYENIKEYLLEY